MKKEVKLNLLPDVDEREYRLPPRLRGVWAIVPNYWQTLFVELATYEPFLGLHSLVNLGIHASLVEWYLEKVGDLVSERKKKELRGMVWAHLFHDLGKLMVLDNVGDVRRVISQSGECCGFSEDELFEIRKQHPWLGGYALQDLEEIVGRVEGIEWGERWSKITFGHHEALDGLPVKSYPRSQTREQDSWMLLSLLFAQLADSLSAGTLDRPYRDVNPRTGRRNLSQEENLRWLEILLDGTVLQKIFGQVEEKKLTKFRGELLSFLSELRVELEERFGSEMCLRGNLSRSEVGVEGLIEKLRVVVAKKHTKRFVNK